MPKDGEDLAPYVLLGLADFREIQVLWTNSGPGI